MRRFIGWLWPSGLHGCTVQAGRLHHNSFLDCRSDSADGKIAGAIDDGPRGVVAWVDAVGAA